MSKVASGMEEMTGTLPLEVKQHVVASANEQINQGALNLLRTELGPDELAHAAINELSSIVELARMNGSGSKIRLDLSLARGLSYYTGSIMEISVSGIGSLGGGGRYDNLVGMFLGKDVPACGFSLGLERIIVVMSERKMFPEWLASSPADVMVTIWNEESIDESIALATELRKMGLSVDLYPEADKLSKQLKYASARGIPLVAIVGDNEKGSGQVALKNMATGEQLSKNKEALFRWLREEPKRQPTSNEALFRWLRGEEKPQS